MRADNAVLVYSSGSSHRGLSGSKDFVSLFIGLFHCGEFALVFRAVGCPSLPQKRSGPLREAR